MEPAKERQRSERGREIVDGASAWLRKETKKTRRGKFLAPRGATSAATTNDAAAATSVRAVVWAWCQCHPPFSFLAWTGPGGSPDLGRRRRGPPLVLAFRILGTAYLGGGAQRITAAGVGQPPSWGLHVAADCYADFWSIFFRGFEAKTDSEFQISTTQITLGTSAFCKKEKKKKEKKKKPTWLLKLAQIHQIK